MLDEVIQEFHQELVETMKGLQQRVQDPPLQLRGEGLHLPVALGTALGAALQLVWVGGQPRPFRPSVPLELGEQKAEPCW